MTANAYVGMGDAVVTDMNACGCQGDALGASPVSWGGSQEGLGSRDGCERFRTHARN